MLSILSTRRVALWTRLFKQWLTRKFDSISIDLTPVEEKLDNISAALDGVAQEATSQEILTKTEAAKDAAVEAKTAAQGITGYALQGSDSTATNTAIAELIGYTIQEIDEV